MNVPAEGPISARRGTFGPNGSAGEVGIVRAMTSDLEQPEPSTSPAVVTTPSSTDAWLITAVVVAVLALVAATIAVGASWSDTGGGSSTATSGGQAMVSIKEFTVAPASVGVGGSLHVMNEGTVAHNLTVEGTQLKTSELAAGASENLDLKGLAAGTYTMFCNIPGHREAGMQATLTVTSDGGAVASAGGGGAPTAMDYQKMTDDMLSTFKAFPAKTAGVGNVLLDPTEVLADGTKVFDLTMKMGKWEVEPGRTVDAYTFNGTVPGPMMKLAVGDKVKVRVKNELPMASDVHFHGLNVDNRFDGVSPITQDLIQPGDTFTYEFTTDEQAVAMYHPHAHGYELVPDGMFGVVLVGQVRLPLGRTLGLEQVPANLTISQEIPMVLNDSGTIGFSLNGKSFPATQPYAAKVGDWVLIHYYNEGTMIHPMHLHQFDQIVVAKDGYPLDAPYTADTVTVAPGERYSVLVHLDKPGTWVWHCHILPHVERESGMFGMATALIVS